MKYLQTIKKNDKFPLSPFMPNTSDMLIRYYDYDCHDMYNKIYSRLNISLLKKLYSLPDKLDT